MALGAAFCVVCGDPPPLTSTRLCESCFRTRTQLSSLPATLQVERCSRCGVINDSGQWGRLEGAELYERWVRSALDVDERALKLGLALHSEVVDERNVRISVQIDGSIEELAFKDEHETILRTSDSVCPTCSRIAGSYFEATVQLRSSGRRLDAEELTELRATLEPLLNKEDTDPLFFVSKEGEVTGGTDIVLGSKALARIWGRTLIQRFGGQTKETQTVVGHRDGLDITRLTLLYRKPAFSLGDVVRWRKEHWRLAGWQKDGALLLGLHRNHRTGVKWRDLESTHVECRMADQHLVDLVNRDNTAGEFLDPHDWQMREVLLPYDFSPTDNSIRIAFIGDGWVALPHIGADDGADEDE